MKQAIRIITVMMLILTLTLSAVACRSGSSDENKSFNNDSNTTDVAQKEDPYVGVYTGTSNETHYWDGGAQKQREKSFYVYKRVNFYYATTAVSAIQEKGSDKYYEDIYINGNRDIDKSFSNGNVSTYVDICHLNDVQYTSASYEITFGDNGEITIKWDSKSIYGDDEPQPYETGVFTGLKK